MFVYWPKQAPIVLCVIIKMQKWSEDTNYYSYLTDFLLKMSV